MLRIAKKIMLIIIAMVLIACAYWGYSAYKQQEFRNNIASNIKGVVCWGDSLTYGAGGGDVTYPSTLYSLISSNIGDIPVYNLGVGGESSKQIMARSGALDIVIDTDVLIPAERETVEVDLILSDGSKASILRQGKAGIEKVSINGISGQLSIEQESATSENYTYYFTRENAGREASVTAGTPIHLDSSLIYKNYLPIIFIGTNGGWTTPDELIEQIERMVAGQYQMGRERYLVIGLIKGTAEDGNAVEAAMEERFGMRYINARKYFSTEAMGDAGLIPTAEDEEMMAAGSVPQSLKSDSVHLNAAGYELLGKLVYDRMMTCGYFDYKIKVK